MRKALLSEIDQTEKLIAYFLQRREASHRDTQELLRKQARLKDRISFYQHERLIHLLITLLFAILVFASITLVMIIPSIPIFIVTALFTCLLVPYIFHYFYLENGVQKLYQLYDELLKISEVSCE